MSQIFVDADACPVKQEVYRVAARHDLKVILVANSWMQTPLDARIELVVVGKGLDVADDWIADRAGEADVVVTTDIPLAARCLENGAQVLGPTGKVFTEEMIGEALASRELLQQLREAGVVTGGPPPFAKRDRSRFLQNLDELIRKAIRRQKG